MLCTSVRYPARPTPDFDLAEFIALREQYAISLTEACVVAWAARSCAPLGFLWYFFRVFPA